MKAYTENCEICKKPIYALNSYIFYENTVVNIMCKEFTIRKHLCLNCKEKLKKVIGNVE